jgi:hypothetical protein
VPAVVVVEVTPTTWTITVTQKRKNEGDIEKNEKRENGKNHGEVVEREAFHLLPLLPVLTNVPIDMRMMTITITTTRRRGVEDVVLLVMTVQMTNMVVVVTMTTK